MAGCRLLFSSLLLSILVLLLAADGPGIFVASADDEPFYEHQGEKR